MTDATDDIEHYENDDNRTDKEKKLIKKYESCKNELIQLYYYGESSIFTLQEIIQLTKILYEWEI